MGSSYSIGKGEVCTWIRKNFTETSTVLDMGAGEGTWQKLLPEYTMDAVEIFTPYADKLNGYRQVFNSDITGFEYGPYDLIIFGDVLEHLTVEEAQKVLECAWPRCRDLIVAVPFLYPQGPVGGNEHEAHIQDDLTPSLMAVRYPKLAVLHDTGQMYAYYHKGVL